MTRLYRIYFNSRHDAPQIWSVDEGTQSSEIHVRGVHFESCWIDSMYKLDAAHGEPSGWLSVWAVMTLRDGIAHFGPQ